MAVIGAPGWSHAIVYHCIVKYYGEPLLTFFSFHFRVSACSLKDDCAEILRSAFWSSECRLRELDLGYNNLTPDGVKLVLQGLLSPNCVIQILR